MSPTICKVCCGHLAHPAEGPMCFPSGITFSGHPVFQGRGESWPPPDQEHGGVHLQATPGPGSPQQVCCSPAMSKEACCWHPPSTPLRCRAHVHTQSSKEHSFPCEQNCFPPTLETSRVRDWQGDGGAKLPQAGSPSQAGHLACSTGVVSGPWGLGAEADLTPLRMHSQPQAHPLTI